MLLLLNRIILVVFISLFSFSTSSEEAKPEFIKTKWSFEGIFGTFDRASLQRGYKVFQGQLRAHRTPRKTRCFTRRLTLSPGNLIPG